MLFRSILKHSVVLLGLLQLASSATLRCYRSTFDDYVDVPVESPAGLVTGVNGGTPCLDVTKPTTFVAIGYKFDPFGPLLTALIPALLSLLNINVVLVNWVEEAGDGGAGDAGYYTHCLPESQKVGKAVGEAIADLVTNYTLNPNITTVAHSAGGTVVCVAANKYALITGNSFSLAMLLDPARPGFDPATVYKVPDKTCATRVMSSHCDPGGYGLDKSVGHVDFWLNYKYFVSLLLSSRLQPGCTKANRTTQEIVINGNRCNHDYCWRTFVEAVYQTATFTGGMADNYQAAVAANGNFAVINNYGVNWDTEKQGKFYMRTSATKPYGLGTAGLSGL